MTGTRRGYDRSLGTPVLHRCRTVPATFDAEVVHAVLPPRRPTQTPLSDLRDAGYKVVGIGVLPSEVPGCSEAEGYPRGLHILLRDG